ncbi:DUF1657 domain-containing protein [Clostridium bovifaecis]|uniref:DUF1657 domain-containing protein n=1 Tax=Clostridium bovifaecis TaxID=2184719 RepID=A0A6I6EU83_9CLOT|nr:DUF1657 domain-containing protein [Clostridium bovifaecis]
MLKLILLEIYIDFYDDNENRRDENLSNQMILAKLQKLSADFAIYHTETKDPKTKILYKECEEKMNNMIVIFQSYVDKKVNKNNLYEITKERFYK